MGVLWVRGCVVLWEGVPAGGLEGAQAVVPTAAAAEAAAAAAAAAAAGGDGAGTALALVWANQH